MNRASVNEARWRVAAAFALLAAVAAAVAAAEPARELRVCAQPNNLPFSNQRLEGFENKLAQLVADELSATLRYTWRPQRRGFVRRTLNAGACDLVMGVPSGFEPVLASVPYYRSTYAFVYAKDRQPGLSSFDDPALRGLRIGLHAVGDDGFSTPPAHALARRGLLNNIVGFAMWDTDTVDSPAGRIVDAVASGDIDLAIVWGPFAAYFAGRHPQRLEVRPVSPPPDMSAWPFAYDIAIGVRQGDAALKRELDGVLERRRDQVREILEQYGVPLIGPTAETREGD
ncbi:MAG: quinoprotein dehydrogenase-associated putative ABC transporter substrate-binding protein [Methylibium sp.]|uniref:substrate-binding domain-containing protein n=1 Tax=Methylibium sp. TaxID=2067992 RepID=UPI00181918AD|nr:substrate-binding domain-containing protein [Methylibium sp.]MBA3595918.1 quinoprotein dehydrogenase-associated putative ABC transporter substrate-binding protein [Methylibium sp.]